MHTEIVVFDVNETLLDLTALDPWFQRVFGRADARAEWFARMLHWSMVVTLTNRFRDFSTLAMETLEVLAHSSGITITDPDRGELVRRIETLPAHPDVEPGLQRLQDAGLQLAALTNSARATVDRQLDNAGLTAYFERILSVDAVGRYKPHAAVYHHAAATLDVPLQDICMVAAHDWDITGAMAAGCHGAFVCREPGRPHPAGTVPDIIGDDLPTVADTIIANH